MKTTFGPAMPQSIADSLELDFLLKINLSCLDWGIGTAKCRRLGQVDREENGSNDFRIIFTIWSRAGALSAQGGGTPGKTLNLAHGARAFSHRLNMGQKEKANLLENDIINIP